MLKKRTWTRLEEEDYIKLEKVAKKETRSVAGTIRAAVLQYISYK
jgi:hypothetical protein